MYIIIRKGIMGKGLSKNAKKQLVNILFLLLLVGITLFILFTSNRELNFENVKNFILGCNPWLIAAAFACMLLFIGFEGVEPASHFPTSGA